MHHTFFLRQISSLCSIFNESIDIICSQENCVSVNMYYHLGLGKISFLVIENLQKNIHVPGT